MRDAWANIDEMPKTHAEKDLFFGPKMSVEKNEGPLYLLTRLTRNPGNPGKPTYTESR